MRRPSISLDIWEISMGWFPEHEATSVSISINRISRMSRFSTLICSISPSLRSSIQLVGRRGYFGAKARPRMIDIVPPLTIPYGAIDIRREQAIPKTVTYPDLFGSQAPHMDSSLVVSRREPRHFSKNTKNESFMWPRW